MNVHHEAVLADIQRRVATEGATLDEVDAAVAAELGVPVECYYDYLLVWAAIEVHRHGQALAGAAWPYTASAVDDTVAACRGLVDRVGLLGATIYKHAVELGPVGTEAADDAGEVLGAVLQLRGHLRELDGGPGPTAGRRGEGRDNGQTVRP